jgi:hypothetical protein
MQVKDTRERLLSSVHREQGKVPARAGGGGGLQRDAAFVDSISVCY